MTRNILFLGYGYTAKALAALLRTQGWTVAGTTRAADKAAAMYANGVEPVLWTESGLDTAPIAKADAILVSVPPNANGCPAFAAARDAIASKAQTIEWLGYLSTNGVYGDHDGAWVDEESDLRLSSPRARARVAAEADWAMLGVEYSLPFAIFRLPGIYGPGRSALDAVREGRARRVFKEGQVFSRMHVDDIAAALAASLLNPRAGELFNLADDEPSPPQDVVEFACRLLSVEPPPLTPLEEADLSEMARSFYTDNKRVSNRRAKSVLGLNLAYPTYREGLKAIYESEKGDA